MASIAHPESFYQCASYCSLRLLADVVTFASCTSCHVVASLQGRIRRGGATCTPKTRTFSNGIYSIHDACGLCRTSSVLVSWCWSAFQRAAISKHRYGVIGLTWRSRSAASDGRKIVLITLPLKVSRSRLAPNPTALPSRGLPSRCLSFRSWTISTSICTEKKIAPATQIFV